MNIELRQPDVSQKTRLKIIDVDIHPKSAMEDLKPYLSKRWWDHIQTYRGAHAPGLPEGLSLSEEPADGVAPRQLAARRRVAGERSQLHEAAVSRSLSRSNTPS